MTTHTIKKRRVWIAALLCLCGGPLGQLYAGAGKRYLALTILTLTLYLLCNILVVFWPFGKLAFGMFMLVVLCYPVFIVVDACVTARKHNGTPLKWFQRWWFYPLVWLLYIGAYEGVAWINHSFIAESFFMLSGSMAPTIVPGDRFFVDKLTAHVDEIDYDAVVVFHSDGPNSPIYIMRVVGLGGDTIEIVDEKVIVNGEHREDQYADFSGPPPTYPGVANMQHVEIPTDSFFVLGDNRRHSKDSRFLGPIPNADYVGNPTRIFWSTPRIINSSGSQPTFETGPIAWERIGMAIR